MSTADPGIDPEIANDVKTDDSGAVAREKLSDADKDASTPETPDEALGTEGETAGPDEEAAQPDKPATTRKSTGKKAGQKAPGKAAKKAAKKAPATTAKKAGAKAAGGKAPSGKAAGAKAAGTTAANPAGADAEDPKGDDARTDKARTDKARTDDAKAAGMSAGGADAPGAKKAARSANQKSNDAKTSATSRRAAEARAAKQRQHRRIELVRALAIGVEVAGAAGLVLASLLPWDWDERLLGRTDNPSLATQVLIGVAIVALVAGWIRPRNDSLGTWTRVVAMPAAATAGILSVAAVWQADLGARGPGGIVAAVAAALAIAGSVCWLVALRRLRKLFAFGMVYARDHGYGNLAAVRRAQLIGAPVGAVGAAAVVAGTLLVAPGIVTTVDASSADPLVLEGATPAAASNPSWTDDVEVNLDRAESAATTYPTPGGLLVDEAQGVRLIDPRDNSERWHWRDEAYFRAGTILTSAGATAVLALRYDGDGSDRDRVVALDTATGEVRWDRTDPELVEAITTLPEGAADADWFAVPDRVETTQADPADPNAAPGGSSSSGIRVIGADDGETRWRQAGASGCTLSRVDADAPDTLVATEECTPEESATSRCQVSGWDAATGSQRWTWAAEDRIDPATEVPTSCQATVLGDIALLTYQVSPAEPPEDPADQPEPPRTPAVALDLRTGEEAWVIEPEDDSYASGGVDGVSTPELVGDTIVGPEYPSGQAGVGAPALVLRSVTDGSKIGEVELPEGQPIEFGATSDDTLAMSYYQQAEPPKVLLVEVDLAAGEVTGETLVFESNPSLQIASAGLAVGPELLVVDTLLGSGPDDVRLRLHGYA